MFSKDYTDKKVLEVGCGMGLSSLLLNKKSVDITATDYHPEVKQFLKNNTDLNNDKEIPFVLANWLDTQNLSLETYDVIVGSDLLYERDSAKILADFINAHAKEVCTVVLTDPKRGHIGKFTKMMNYFGFEHTKISSTDIIDMSDDYKGNVNCYIRK